MRIESSFIQVPGIGEKTEQSLWESGVTSWRDRLDTSPVGPKTGDRLQDFAERARTELERSNVRYFASALPSGERWRLLDSFRPRATAMDIETTGLDPSRDVVTTVTFDGPAETRTLVRGQDLTAETIESAIADAGFIVTFNGSQFDIPFLERRFDLDISCPHVDLRYPCRRVGWTGGLKQIERTLDIDRALPAVDGREAVRLWHQYERGDDAALDRLVRYNREDTRTLLPIADRLVTTLDRRVFDPYRS